ncbi:MAG: translation initiation factor IF-2 [Tenericutes bacterium]|nr:translation initiation factor IF-2 [Mycoplasmatota bacterium]MDD6941340.1 translation initiation factor IF-2 [bacterium]MDY2697810.1 translation initiation factor IF-2 [Bacilli bacterium]
MMTIEDYALDVGKTIDEIKALCDKIGINYEDEKTPLDETDIILLDNEQQDAEDYITGDIEDLETKDYEEEVSDKAEKLAMDTKFDLDNETNFQKVKSKPVKKAENKKEFFKERKKIYKHREKLQSNETEQDANVILYENGMTVSDLAKALEVGPVEVVKKLMALGIMASVNQSIDYDSAEVVASEYDKVLKKAETADISNFENYEISDAEEDLVERPPVVTIMGHVDHGKTTLLDYIRKSNVASGEAGGITQAIGAYSVKYKDKSITFIDTPGHEAFTEMRARGASITDIVIIIVAADDGVMPQTKEAIDHAKAAGVPIIVAINKIDKPDANIERIMTALVENGLTPEEWGGDVIVNKISAATGENVNELLDNILLVAEMEGYKANPSRYATGAVIESRKDSKVGSVITLLIQNGTLRLGDPIVIGNSFGKVRTLKNDLGQNIVEASPSTPVEVTGISEVPSAGDKFMAFESEKQAKQIAEERKLRSREKDSNFSGMTLEDLFGRIQEGIKEIKIVLKADVNGSLEAVKNSLEKISVDGVKVSVIRGAVGAITESDIVLASASDALIIGFNVRANQKTMDMAKQYNITIKTYDIIYKVVEDMEKAMKGMLDPEYEEKVTGTLEVRQIFKFSKIGLIAGCHVLSGTVKNNQKARIIRDDVVVYNGSVKTLQHEKDQVKEVKKDMDCGITLENCQDYKEKDIIEVYDLVEIKR